MTRSIAKIAEAVMEEANGLRRDADTLLGDLEAIMPARIVMGAEGQPIIDALATAASLAEISARGLDAAAMRLRLLGTVIAGLSETIETGADNDEAELVERARQLRLLLLDCAGSRLN